MKILLLYATVSGNSAMLSEQLKDKLSAAHPDHAFEIKDADNSRGENFADVDLVIFASSTWDDGSMNLIAEDFLGQLSGIEGKKFALIGLGDSSYPTYNEGVDKVEAKLRELGAEIVGSVHKVDGFVDDEKVEAAFVWAQSLLG